MALVVTAWFLSVKGKGIVRYGHVMVFGKAALSSIKGWAKRDSLSWRYDLAKLNLKMSYELFSYCYRN